MPISVPFQHLWFLFLFVLPVALSQEDVTIIVSGSATIAETDNNFICATIDWWPSDKCNYNQCPWGQTSALNLDLNHPFLAKAIKAFNPLRIRVGGSLQDQLVYGMPNLGYPCNPFSKMQGGLFGFSEGCLSMERWNELNLLFQKSGLDQKTYSLLDCQIEALSAVITFGLNALYGRHHGRGNMWEGDWNSSNARDFIEYTVTNGYPVDSWEFGNELSGKGIVASVAADQYAKDLIVLKSVLKDLYKSSHVKPLLVAPGGFFDPQWYAQLLEDSGPDVVNAVTHHMYNLGAGSDIHIADTITNPESLGLAADIFRNLQLTIERHGPWASAWVGEAGGAYNSGSRLVSNKFVNSFWYLDQLGMASRYNTKTYCRQTLIGANYGLLDGDTFVPNPDYYSALLWHRLMGKGVLSIDISGSSMLRAYAHCTKGKAGVTILLINLSKSTRFGVTVRNDLNLVLAMGEFQEGSFVHGLKRTVSWIGKKALVELQTREEYHLTAQDDDPLSQDVLLNGVPLQLTDSGDVPTLDPVYVAVDSPLSLAPLSIAFVVFPNFEARVCGR